MIRLLVVDDQVLVRQGLASLLSLESDFEIVGECGHGDEAVSLAKSLIPDVILMDIRMPVLNGVEATKLIHVHHPRIKILILTTFDDDEFIVQAMQAGASGYLLKDSPTEQLAAAIRAVHCGTTQLGPTIVPKILSLVPPVTGLEMRKYNGSLTVRELEVLRLLGQGKCNKEIAQALSITEGTVKNHITRILTQLDLRDRTQAALWAQQHQI